MRRNVVFTIGHSRRVAGRRQWSAIGEDLRRIIEQECAGKTIALEYRINTVELGDLSNWKTSLAHSCRHQ